MAETQQPKEVIIQESKKEISKTLETLDESVERNNLKTLIGKSTEISRMINTIESDPELKAKLQGLINELRGIQKKIATKFNPEKHMELYYEKFRELGTDYNVAGRDEKTHIKILRQASELVSEYLDMNTWGLDPDQVRDLDGEGDIDKRAAMYQAMSFYTTSNYLANLLEIWDFDLDKKIKKSQDENLDSQYFKDIQAIKELLSTGGDLSKLLPKKQVEHQD